MPTGYTAGIIEGTTKTFQEFAKHCMKNFGACIHMRDETSDKPYEPREPTDYHVKELQNAKDKLQQAEELTDRELVEIRKGELIESKKYHIKNIQKIKVTRKKLDKFLLKAKAYESPTKNHEGIKKFMIEQLETTINYDGDYSYHEKELPKIEMELKHIDANDIRFTLIEKARKDITYHLEEHKKELERCVISNKWVLDFINAL